MSSCHVWKLPRQEIAKVKAKGVYSQSVEVGGIKHDVSLFLHSRIHCVKTIQKVCRPVSDFLQVGLLRGLSEKTITTSKTIVKLSEFLNQRSTKAFWFEDWSVFATEILWMVTSRKQVTNRHCVADFSRLTSFKYICI